MVIDLIRVGNQVVYDRKLMLRAALVLGLLVIPEICMAQTSTTVGNQTPTRTPTPTPTPPPRPSPSPPQAPSPVAMDLSQAPLTERERAMLELIKGLQERVTKLEAQVSGAAEESSKDVATAQQTEKPTPTPTDVGAEGPQDIEKRAEGRNEFGTYTPNLGFKVANTEYGDMSVSIYTYARYLNQRALKPTFTDAFGNTKTLQLRQDFQLQKVQVKFLGWILDPKLRYFIYTWTSNPTQGQGAQVVVAGNLNYTFNKYLTFSAGITSLPGVRTTEGNFPFWLGVDSRMIADEFFRPSYTSGMWAKGNITKRLRYQAMVGNNLSTLGVSAARLDNKFNTFSSELVWTPTGDFGLGYGDFEDSKKLGTRLAVHFTRSDEDREEQPNSDTFENTQIRLSDGTVIFTPFIFGPGVIVEDVRYRMTSLDGGLKYRGYSLEGEYYWRWLDKFQGPGTEVIPRLFDQGFQLQAAAMVVPKTVQPYVGYSRVNGQFGNPWDFRVGVNWFPWKNKVVRWNNEWLYLHNSPVGYSSVPFIVGGKGGVFHSSLELAF